MRDNQRTIQFITRLFILLSVNSCQSNKYIGSTEAINIAQIIAGGNHTYSLILGSDSNKINYRYDNIDFYSDEFSKSFENHKHLLSQKAIDHIWKYMEDNCTPSDKNLEVGENTYYIGRTPDTPLYKNGCSIESFDLGKKYFTGLISWIESSQYKDECVYLNQDIQAKFIDSKPFPLTPYYQRKLDSINHSKVIKENNLSK